MTSCAQLGLQPDTSYGFLVGGFMLMGLGMGMVMSPMTSAAMNAVEPTKAGVASGILSMSRMIGGTFGVAVLGAIVALDELGSARAFTDALGEGLKGAAGLALFGALVAALTSATARTPRSGSPSPSRARRTCRSARPRSGPVTG